jgi:hypothetical protein
MKLTTVQQYEKIRSTLVSWINWQKETDTFGLLLGLGDYWTEMRMLEVELGLPATKLSDLLDLSVWC